MKKGFLLIAIAWMFYGCSSINPKVANFEIIQNTIESGDNVNLFWDIEVEDSVMVYITDVGVALPLSGEKVLFPTYSKDYVLNIFKNDKIIHTEKRKVYVVEKKAKPEKKIISSENQNKNNESIYLKGIVDAEEIDVIQNPELEINLIDANSYPKKISLYCTVKDEYGNHIANLAPPYNNKYIDNWKSVVEKINGDDFEIENFSVREFREDGAPPFAVSFVMDYSGSMFSDFQYVNEALKMAVDYLRPTKDVYEVVQFDTEVLKSVSLTKDKRQIVNLIPFGK